MVLKKSLIIQLLEKIKIFIPLYICCTFLANGSRDNDQKHHMFKYITLIICLNIKHLVFKLWASKVHKKAKSYIGTKRVQEIKV